MAVECPAEGCDFAGMVDAVAGHIGGSNDALHAGVVPERAGDGGEAGLSTVQVALLVGAVALVGLAVASVMSSETGSPEPQDGEGEVWMDGA